MGNIMTVVNKPKRFFATNKVYACFLLLIPMLISNNDNVALLNCCVRYVEHQRGQLILNKTLYL